MDKKTARDLFYSMLRIRLVEEKIALLYAEQEMRCPVHFCIGQEAISAGVCAPLQKEDYVMSNHRSHGHYLAKGGDLNAMLAEIYGKKTGCSHGKGGSMHLVDLSVGFLGATPIVGSTIPITTGLAFGSVMKGENRVAVSFFGDAATEEGVFAESLNFAVLKNLPVIFLCENNFYSVNSPLSVRQSPEVEIFKRAAGHGIESYQGDGNDVMQVYKMTKKAVDKARRGQGPAFLEFKTYRWLEHCGPLDDHPVCRPEKEVEKWKKYCPVKKYEKYILAEKILSKGDIKDIRDELNEEIEAAVSFAKKSPFPAENTLYEDIYAP